LGYDSHRFGGDGPLKLGGVEIPHDCGLIGHSDADAALHAITDAILGAAGGGDIGDLFPDTDPQHRGADSSRFLAEAVAFAAGRGLSVVNCDLTVLAEAPKLGNHKRRIKDRISQLLALPPDRVAVKAKTNESMGFIGRGEGLAALAIVTLTDTAEHTT